jgi:hypothetical protein
MRQGHKDIQLAANIAAIALTLYTLTAWALSWPSTAIPTGLLVVGLATVLLGLSVEATTGLANVPGWARVPVLASRILIASILVIAMLALPWLTMAIGAVVLIILLVYGLVKLIPHANARYRPRVTTPAPRRRTPRHDVRRRVGR